MREIVSLKDRYRAVQERIASAAQKAGRSPSDVLLVAVTKFAGMEEIRELIEMGHVDFAENRVQNLVQRAAQVEEFLQRHRQLHTGRGINVPRTVRWHMIGHLQRNKVKKVMALTRLIHSLDSLRLAEEIQAAAGRREEPVEILIQVNTSGEKGKFGMAPAAVRHLIEQMETMMALRPRGLMCMAPLSDDPQASRPTFERCRELFEEVKKTLPATARFDILSMGMSNDFEVGIECGANLVRVGTAIFGPPRQEQVDAEAAEEE